MVAILRPLSSLYRTCRRIYEKLMCVAERLVPTTKAVHDDFAVPITSTRMSVTPLALVTESASTPARGEGRVGGRPRRPRTKEIRSNPGARPESR
jgi:uncharacterized protein (UPF0210 family)